MGDAGEGLIDADARIQERMEERERKHASTGRVSTEDPEVVRAFESLRLARLQLEGQRAAASSDRYKAQLTQAIEEVDRRLAAAKPAK